MDNSTRAVANPLPSRQVDTPTRQLAERHERRPRDDEKKPKSNFDRQRAEILVADESESKPDPKPRVTRFPLDSRTAPASRDDHELSDERIEELQQDAEAQVAAGGPAIGLFTGPNAMREAEVHMVAAMKAQDTAEAETASAPHPSQSAERVFARLLGAELADVRGLAEEVAKYMNRDSEREARFSAKKVGLKNPTYSVERLTAESVHELINQPWLNDNHREAIIACIEAGMAPEPVAE